MLEANGHEPTAEDAQSFARRKLKELEEQALETDRKTRRLLRESNQALEQAERVQRQRGR